MTRTLFADSNVLIEALLVPGSAAYVIAELVARGVFDLYTCELCIEDTEDAIVAKLKNKPNVLDETIANWEELKTITRLRALANPDASVVKETYDKYIGVMRHKADIPVLAAALSMTPVPTFILSGNREHFNDKVAKRCGIPIFSCQELITFIVQNP